MKKADILEEIKRTAEANGRVPLGMQKFASETGIKVSDWRGTHWVRWSDAVREAGLAPNQLTGAYDSKELLNEYAQLAQDLGRLPTDPDLRIKHCNDSRFPPANTFNKRLGTKSALVKQLLEFCRAREEYADVVRLCEEYAPRHREVFKESSDQDAEIGFVYLIKSGRYYKIGKTNAAGRRQYELAIQLPERPKTIHVIRTDDPNGIEAYWHKRFEAKRKNGEWFDLDSKDVIAFRRRKFM